MSPLIRLLLLIPAPVTALFVSRDALNFSVIQTLVTTIMAAALVIAFASWPFGSKTKPKE